MGTIRDDKLRIILQELTGLLQQAYGNRLKAIILYGSAARGTQKEGSDIDIMVFIDGKWYYFDASGALLRNTQTPDGYTVDETGARV